MAASSPPARRRRSAPMRRCGRPISASRRRRAWLTPAARDLDGIETCYGRSQVLFGMSLAIAPGEMVTLMGRNGMGKTTTVRSIMGLTPARAGSIRFDGEEIRGAAVLPGRQARHRPGAGGPADLSQSHRAREPGRHRRQPRRRGRALDARQGLRAVPAAGRAARQHGATCSPAASSRCWRSAAR